MNPDLAEQLAYMVSRVKTNPRACWHHYLDRANVLAASHPDVYQALPEMLRAAMQKSLNQPGRNH
ncbi:MAG: hypothetical protein DI563_02030 [Variovorax paradoxus]|uniref:Uncharacterized protein n=1 Tax=Variovorax paradoxus TaxID=34073 RepID=A0A2W5ST92_VARPD|nr:MAG: hypothetical protein DI563_02030 [Variovorax paradoxus]